MARRQRDYAKEYQQRIAKGKRDAAAKGVPFDRSKARGHKSKRHEQEQRRERSELFRLARNLFIPREEIDSAIDMGYPVDGLLDVLEETQKAREEYEKRGDNRRGLRHWQGRDEIIGDWFYYYHGVFGA